MITTSQGMPKSGANSICEYDAHNNLVSLKQYLDRALVSSYECTYDSSNHIVEEKQYDAKSAQTTSVKFKRNELNLITQQREYNDDDLQCETNYVWHRKLLLKSISSWQVEGVTQEIIFFLEK
ncbi:MAG: hypothetical protein RL660_3021 [Bacteroidota bacterium]|jgi:hypothetical protein